MSIIRLIRSSFQAGRHQAKKGDGLVELAAANGPNIAGNRLSSGIVHLTYAGGRVFDGVGTIARMPLAVIGGPQSAAAAGGVATIGGLLVVYVLWGML